MALPATAMGEEVYFGTFDGRVGNVISQDFSATGGTAADDRYDSRAADDFEVPANTTWHVGLVAAGGRWYRNVKVQDSFHMYASTSDVFVGAADSPVKVRVTIHADAGGRPGGVLRTDTNGQTCGTIRGWTLWTMLTKEERICGGQHGVLATRFDPPLALGPGRYWVSFQVDMDSQIHGEWFWGLTRFTDSRCLEHSTWGCYGKAHWQNPGGGYNTACTLQWGPVSDCIRSYRSPRCAAALGNVTVSTPVCGERRPALPGYGEDLEMLVMATSTTNAKR